MDEEEIPGTWRLVDHGDIILSPTPTKSPNDPLNWSWPRKYWHAILVCFLAGLTAATSNDAGSASTGQNEELGISYGSENTGAGILFVTIGVATYVLSPSSWLYGRRITYLICLVSGLVGAIWFAKVENASDSIWNQLFVGASEACAEANVQLSLTDLFYEHQLGRVIGFYVAATSIGTYLGPLIASYVADSPLGWRWIGWLAVIIGAATIVICYFTLEETVFERPPEDATPIIHCTNKTEEDPELARKEADGTAVGPMNSNSNTGSDIAPDVTELEDKPKSYWQRIAIITPASNLKGTGFKQYVSRLYHTLRLFTFPAILFSGIQWGAQDAWLSFYLTLEEDNWIEGPWYYGDAAVGIMEVPCIIGAVIGCFYGGYLSDIFVLWAARRNGGMREAEQRLWFLIPCAFISTAGMLLFGLGTGHGWSWPVPYVGLAFIGFGWGCVGDLSMTYAAECYSSCVLEGMACISFINNIIACIFTFCAEPWLDHGVNSTFIALGVLDFAIIMLTLPMIYWGKSCRKWTNQRYITFLEMRDSI
ncbi:hypothetical protein ASPZODRAFT_148435 [Penicilliopsis zonata CBS 506.65]|uniref:Major facilitator superfamily (MFS) profile domain-containing protein n=1 Tax=Penicilliopsis zonata CBS 506.65 TaxID=1073090 RepID=A0A1L9SVI7_9EURO|nr:hypothetical protein ASPZODRAFT_148435 [Penicilliopsis zonata CBS 506.65]OJJ51073.1 hypothetical protein ASPZODRAFT_148435 [Penicilliopsis zonata CBS 506.65]